MQLERRAGRAGALHRRDGFDDALGPDHAGDHRDLQRRRRRLVATRKFFRVDARAADDGDVGAVRIEAELARVIAILEQIPRPQTAQP